VDETYGKANVIPEITRVVDTVVGRTAEAYKILPGFGVQVWVKERGMELENWPWKMVTIRQPRLVKRYPRPFRFPREEPTKQCHCKIGLMEVVSVEEAQVRCTRCKFLVGSESYPRRIERAEESLRKADNEIQRGGAKVHKGVSRRRKRTPVRRDKVSVKARKRSKGGVVVRSKRSSNATKSTSKTTRKRAFVPAKRRRPRKISARSRPAISKVHRQVGQKAGAKR
jgi:hypothetical protein